MPLNRGLERFAGPPQPAGLPWARLVHGSGTLIARPRASAQNAGMLYFGTDSGEQASGCLYRSDGVTWRQVAVNYTGITQLTGDGTAGPASGTAALAIATFGAAGGGHARGFVPDPGATGHANVPYLLADTAGFVAPAGKLLAYNLTGTDESTTSATATDLATVHSVSFTLDVAQTVLMTLVAGGYHPTGGNNCSTGFHYAGADDASSRVDTTGPATNYGFSISNYYPKALSAGAYTVKARYFSPNGGAAHFRNRFLGVYLAA